MRIIRGISAARKALARRSRPGLATDSREQAVRDIIADVARRGDAAVLDYTERFDGVRPASLEVSREEIEPARANVRPELMAALELAAGRIRRFATSQLESLHDGAADPRLGWRVRPLGRVGLYAPHGTAAYPSTVLMTAIPARTAGVSEVVLATPPGRDGTIPATTLAAAALAGVDRIFRMGGAQAMAAMALGTESVPRVDKLAGPGNIYVTLAKKLLYGTVGIDGLQGPSEVLIIADESARAADCAADLLAQAEHDALASSLLVTTSPALAEAVSAEVARQLAELPRRSPAEQSLKANGLIIVVDSPDEAVELATSFAPEHLLLLVANPEWYIERAVAGCIVSGPKATIALGDYVEGPNHVLPTAGTARFTSPLSVLDFVRTTNVIHVDAKSLRELGPAAVTIARSEGLEAHARAIEKRLKDTGE